MRVQSTFLCAAVLGLTLTGCDTFGFGYPGNSLAQVSNESDRTFYVDVRSRTGDEYLWTSVAKPGSEGIAMHSCRLRAASEIRHVRRPRPQSPPRPSTGTPTRRCGSPCVRSPLLVDLLLHRTGGQSLTQDAAVRLFRRDGTVRAEYGEILCECSETPGLINGRPAPRIRLD